MSHAATGGLPAIAFKENKRSTSHMRVFAVSSFGAFPRKQHLLAQLRAHPFRLMSISMKTAFGLRSEYLSNDANKSESRN